MKDFIENINLNITIYFIFLLFLWIFKEYILSILHKLVIEIKDCLLKNKKWREFSLEVFEEKLPPFIVGKEKVFFFSQAVAWDYKKTKKFFEKEITKARTSSSTLALVFVLTDRVSNNFAQAFKEVLQHCIDKNNISLNIIFPFEGKCETLDTIKQMVEHRIDTNNVSCILVKTDCGNPIIQNEDILNLLKGIKNEKNQ